MQAFESPARALALAPIRHHLPPPGNQPACTMALRPPRGPANPRNPHTSLLAATVHNPRSLAYDCALCSCKPSALAWQAANRLHLLNVTTVLVSLYVSEPPQVTALVR